MDKEQEKAAKARDAALNTAETHATAQAASANARLLRGSLAAIGIAAALLGSLFVVAIRVRRRTEERFRSLVEQSSEILLVLDADCRVTDVTEAAVRRTLGWDPAQLRGRHVEELLEEAHVRAEEILDRDPELAAAEHWLLRMAVRAGEAIPA